VHLQVVQVVVADNQLIYFGGYLSHALHYGSRIVFIDVWIDIDIDR